MKKIVALLVLSVALVGCGEVVEIPPAHVAKLSTPNGLGGETLTPSKIRLSSFCITCDSLVLLQAADFGVKEQLTLFMPKDKLNLTIDVRGTLSLSNDKDTVNRVFSRIPPQQKSQRVSLISMNSVYSTYAAPVIRTAVRSALTEYSIMDIMENREGIGSEIAADIKEKLKGTPISVLRIELADVQPPDVIVKAQEKAKEREIAIQQAEADKQVALKQAEAALEVAVKQQQVDLKEAETQVLVAKKLAEGVSPAFVTQRSLKILDKAMENPAKTFFLPQEAFANPAMLIGATRIGVK